MFISLDKVFNGSTLENEIEDYIFRFNSDIEYYEQEIQKESQKQEDPHMLEIERLVKLDVKDLTEEDKQCIIKNYKLAIQKMNLLGAMFGMANIGEEVSDNPSDIEIQIYQTTLETMVLSKSTSSMLDYYRTERDKCITHRDGYLCFTVSKENFFKNYDYIYGVCVDALRNGKKIKFAISQDMREQSNDDVANYVYSGEEFNKIIDFNNRLKTLGMEENVKFNEYRPIDTLHEFDDAWDLEHVKLANDNVDKVVDYIKKQNFTPYEAMIFIHRYITKNFEYRQTTVNSNDVIVGAYNKKAIICSGYASLTKAIIDKLGDPNLSCDLISCKFYTDKHFPQLEGSHCQCLVHINDPKYNINGHYINDACWDARTQEFKSGRGFGHFMYPVNDVMHLNNAIYVQQSEGNRQSTLVFNPQELQERFNATYSKSMIVRFFKKLSYSLREKEIVSKHIPEVVKKYGDQSPAIPMETFDAAIQEVFSRVEGKTQQELQEAITKYKTLSMANAATTFDGEASNVFYRAASQKLKVKKSKGLLHSKDKGVEQSQ